jgi:hypothetical protein
MPGKRPVPQLRQADSACLNLIVHIVSFSDSLQIADCFRQKPFAPLSLVNPILNQTSGSDIVMLRADFMRQTQEPRQFAVVVAKLC